MSLYKHELVPAPQPTGHKPVSPQSSAPVSPIESINVTPSPPSPTPESVKGEKTCLIHCNRNLQDLLNGKSSNDVDTIIFT